MSNSTGLGRYKIKTIAELCGFSPTLLRAWERRYDLLEPERQPSGHRLYTEDDLRVLRQVKQLMDQGRSIGEIAALGRESLLAVPKPTPRVRPAAPAPPPVPSSLSDYKHAILEATTNLNEQAVRQQLDQALTSHSREEVLYGLVTAVANEVGALWATGAASVASEHLLTAVVSARLRAWIEELGQPEPDAPPLLCAGMPDEQHEIGLLAVNYELRKKGHRVVYLGGSLPLEDLERAILQAKPSMVFLSVTREATFEIHRHRLYALASRNPEVTIVVGGSGVARFEADLTQAGIQHWPTFRPLHELNELITVNS